MPCFFVACVSEWLATPEAARRGTCVFSAEGCLTHMCDGGPTALRSGIFTTHEYNGSNNKTILAKSLWGLRKDLITLCLSFLISSSKVLFKGCVLDGLIPSLTCCPSQLVSWWLTLLQWLSGSHAAAAMGSGLPPIFYWASFQFLLSRCPAVHPGHPAYPFFHSALDRPWVPSVFFTHREVLWQGSHRELSIALGLFRLSYVLRRHWTHDY